MSLLDYGADATLAASPRYVAPPRVAPEPKFSAWSAVPRGVAEAGAQVLGTAADAVSALQYMGNATPEQRRQMDATGVPVSAFSSEFGDSLRDRGRELRPDPQTASVAEQLLYGFARGASKIVGGAVVGGVPGVLAMGLEEAVSQSDDLRRAGVTDPGVRATAGAVQGAGLALAALPAVGASLKATAALYLAGGPGGFMAQQALTREVLRNGGQEKLAEQYDPFDPVGLAVSALIPAGFAVWGVRGQRIAAAKAKEAEFMAGPVPSEVAGTAAAVRGAYSPEIVDAARVAYAVEARAASNPAGDGMAAMAAHETALAKAEAAIARGDLVAVTDLVPPRPIESLEQFAARAKIKDSLPPRDVTGGFLSWLNQVGGVDFAQKWDITNERGGILSNPAGVFRKGGLGIDDLALQAEGAGYLRPGEGAESRNFVDLLQRAIAGERILTMEESMVKYARDKAAAEYEARLASVEARLRLLGVDPAPARGNLALLEAYAKDREPQLLAAALDEMHGAREAGPEYDALQDRARQIVQDMQDGERTRQQYEAEVQPLSPVMRRMVDEIAAAQSGREPPAQPAGKPRDLRAETIALRRESAVLQKLKECLA